MDICYSIFSMASRMEDLTGRYSGNLISSSLRIFMVVMNCGLRWMETMDERVPLQIAIFENFYLVQKSFRDVKDI